MRIVDYGAELSEKNSELIESTSDLRSFQSSFSLQRKDVHHSAD